MKSNKPKNRKAMIAFTVITFGFAFYTQIIWGIVETRSDMQKDPIQSFLSYFPPFSRNIALITLLTLACSIITIIFSSIWINRSSGRGKVLPIVFLVLSIMITLLTLFQLL
jgi:archaellum biogenesis protein FlaJ (TadC family)